MNKLASLLMDTCPGADPGFLRGGPKFEIMRAKLWYVTVTSSGVMSKNVEGGGQLKKSASPHSYMQAPLNVFV